MEIVEWIRHWDVLERYLVPRRLHLYELRRKEPLYNPRWPPRRRGLLLANTRQEAPPWFTARDGMIYWDFLFRCFRSLIHLARTSLDSARADVNERGNNGELTKRDFGSPRKKRKKKKKKQKKKEEEKKKKQENKRCGLGVSGPREFLGGVYELKIRLKKGETRTDDKGRMLEIARASERGNWEDRRAGRRMAVRIYGRFITLPALPRLL
ncbi:hypothetical protein V1477_020284 [Vespula maculifrons]|uniref:Uncharacterized protein n=1 Tax=Vespula maculifrons TaxID=7453 RepID=A0ABD2ALH9_VESMC